MKKLLLLVLVSVILMLAFTSCTIVFKDMIPTPEETEHEHSYIAIWNSDALTHFRKCECGEKGDVASHADENADGVCDTCTYRMPVELITHLLTVEVKNEDGTIFFGSTYTVIEGEESVFDIMVGVEYTLASEALTELSATVNDGVRTYTFKHAAITEDTSVTLVATLCTHSFVDATCVAPVTCELCTLEVGEPLGHDWNVADCVTAKTCATCGETDGEPLGHTPGVNASCLDAQICEVCGDTLVEALGHNGVDVPGYAETCTESGLTTGSVCGLCGLTLVEQEEIAPHGHASGDWIVDEAATCTGEGSQHKECQTCGATTKTESISATGHKDEDGDLACDSCGNPV